MPICLGETLKCGSGACDSKALTQPMPAASHATITLIATTRFRFILFFFSSRRRHTRSTRDWSSDVCSSDLDVLASRWHVRQALDLDRNRGTRSEERRVGKECRSRRWPDCYQKNKNAPQV